MSLSARLAVRLRSARTWIALGVVAPIGMLAVSALMLLDLRHEAWVKAEQTSHNLLQVLERDIARNVEIYDLSLRGVIEAMRAPGALEAAPALRQLMLFDRAATARDMGVLLVLDEKGEAIFDAASWPPRKLNNADRDYFQAHKARADLGLHISDPVVSKLQGSRVVVLSRRYDKPDGTFGGIVIGTLKLSYFDGLFDRIGLGRDGAINLYGLNGTRLMRHPYADGDIGVSLAGTVNVERFKREGRGSFVGASARDTVERLYTFTRVGDLPLILNVALSTAEIEHAWRVKAGVVGALVVVLCGLAAGLSLLFGRELGRRAAVEAELAELSVIDALTGLANRRRFEGALAQAWIARTAGRPVSLLVVDADHFKTYNDRFGHHVGDLVLQRLARAIAATVHRPEDVVCRVGGEEFVLLLPGTDANGAARVAQRVHASVATMHVREHGITVGMVTVSIGVAGSDELGIGGPADLYRSADRALYAAKASGRNRTCRDPERLGEPSSAAILRLVGA